jgi:hypothetical protein
MHVGGGSYQSSKLLENDGFGGDGRLNEKSEKREESGADEVKGARGAL